MSCSDIARNPHFQIGIFWKLDVVIAIVLEAITAASESKTNGLITAVNAASNLATTGATDSPVRGRDFLSKSLDSDTAILGRASGAEQCDQNGCGEKLRGVHCCSVDQSDENEGVRVLCGVLVFIRVLLQVVAVETRRMSPLYMTFNHRYFRHIQSDSLHDVFKIFIAKSDPVGVVLSKAKALVPSCGLIIDMERKIGMRIC